MSLDFCHRKQIWLWEHTISAPLSILRNFSNRKMMLLVVRFLPPLRRSHRALIFAACVVAICPPFAYPLRSFFLFLLSSNSEMWKVKRAQRRDGGGVGRVLANWLTRARIGRQRAYRGQFPFFGNRCFFMSNDSFTI